VVVWAVVVIIGKYMTAIITAPLLVDHASVITTMYLEPTPFIEQATFEVS